MVGRDGRDGLESVYELVGTAVGVIEADELRFVRVGIWIGDEVGVRIVGYTILVWGDGFIGFLKEEGDVFDGGYLYGGVTAVDLVGEGFDCVFGLGRDVVYKGAEEAPFFEGSNDGLGFVRSGDRVSVGRYYFKEIVHIFKDFIVRGAAIKGASAEGMNGGCLAGVRLGVLNCAFEGGRCGFVDQVGGRGYECHRECCRR